MAWARHGFRAHGEGLGLGPAHPLGDSRLHGGSVQADRACARWCVSSSGEAADLLAPGGSLGSTLARLMQAWEAATAAMEAVARLAGTPAARMAAQERTDWLSALSQHLAGWSGAARHIQEWCAWRGVSQSAAAQGLGPLIQAMEDGVVGPDGAVRALEANYARWWIDLAVDASPRLRSFVAAKHETRIERFRVLDARMLVLSSRLARARIASGVPSVVARQVDPEYALLTRELAKRQRHLPIRQLAARMPKALRRLTPCLMMSPLSVAQYLPAEAEPFDLVIFDEASQITTWDAIGAVGRGRQVIVVGDPRQLPPTSFFERRSSEADDASVEVETHDLDSILDECLGAGIPTVELTWHYRSRHESLIAFSNQVYYGSRLVTFPSPVTWDDAVSFHYVPNGVYARGAGRTNEAEARAVLAEALAVLRAPEQRSLGIVTFNAEQQTMIEDLLDKARRDDPSLERHFSDDAAEPVLIKNLEGVQGEERDVMLFSLTYGPDATGRIGLNFGPAEPVGGRAAVERRRDAGAGAAGRVRQRAGGAAGPGADGCVGCAPPQAVPVFRRAWGAVVRYGHTGLAGRLREPVRGAGGRAAPAAGVDVASPGRRVGLPGRPGDCRPGRARQLPGRGGVRRRHLPPRRDGTRPRPAAAARA